jgi:hypothetical protein
MKLRAPRARFALVAGPVLVAGLIFFACCNSPWKDPGLQGPWCAPNTRARIYYRNLPGIDRRDSKIAYADKSGRKIDTLSFLHELDEYFGKCTFIRQWPKAGTINGVTAHQPPFDLWLVSMDPTVIVGVQKPDPKKSALGPTDPVAYRQVHSTALPSPIVAWTTLPYHRGAEVVWFSPSTDYDLHPIDLKSGSVRFAISETEWITVAVVKSELVTRRE